MDAAAGSDRPRRQNRRTAGADFPASADRAGRASFSRRTTIAVAGAVDAGALSRERRHAVSDSLPAVFRDGDGDSSFLASGAGGDDAVSRAAIVAFDHSPLR